MRQRTYGGVRGRDREIPPTRFTNPYIKAATSENTRRAYQADIRHFEQFGGVLPANKEHVIVYLTTFAAKLNSRTLTRRLTALKNWHVYQGFPDPTQHPAVRKTLAGILRTHGKPKDKAPPLLPEQLAKIIQHLETQQTPQTYRDRALLQLAFFGAFRRSEIVAIYRVLTTFLRNYGIRSEAILHKA